MDKFETIMDLELRWWGTHLSDKTVLVGSGPSILEYPYGKTIDLFRNVIRINNFNLDRPNNTGSKVTHAVIHMATKKGPFGKISNKKNILFAPFEYSGQKEFLQKRVNQRTGSRLDLNKVTMLPDYYFTGLG